MFSTVPRDNHQTHYAYTYGHRVKTKWAEHVSEFKTNFLDLVFLCSDNCWLFSVDTKICHIFAKISFRIDL